jgi:sialic acid synthase SpsE
MHPKFYKEIIGKKAIKDLVKGTATKIEFFED